MQVVLTVPNDITHPKCFASLTAGVVYLHLPASPVVLRSSHKKRLFFILEKSSGVLNIFVQLQPENNSDSLNGKSFPSSNFAFLAPKYTVMEQQLFLQAFPVTFHKTQEFQRQYELQSRLLLPRPLEQHQE